MAPPLVFKSIEASQGPNYGHVEDEVAEERRIPNTLRTFGLGIFISSSGN
ncbi:hypothetical protein PanWU01x14_345990 [Parasponia andersonii]|uniref:Uncharacterized protein n=1 Tax=Parasponia andersonii TaxID=3476 RepID=A0A2P5ACI1_PARAD|nr:hypothetical protein PanWU01x14_345990 [Parasponia andersonii]